MAFNLVESGKRILTNLLSTPPASRALTRTIGTRDNITKGLEPQHTYMWEIVTRGLFGVNEDLKFYAQRCSLPAPAQGMIRRRYAGVEYTYSGRDESVRILRVTFWDNQELQMYRLFYKWYRRMNTFGDNAKVTPINYMQDMSIRLKDTSDSFITEEFFFVDCFPTEIGEVELDYSSSGVFTFDVTFSFNDMRVEGEGHTNIQDAINLTRRVIGGVSQLNFVSNIVDKAVSQVRKFF